MRRISLALALVGAVAAAGCSGGAKSSSDAGGNKGVADGTFSVTIQNTAPLAIKGGYVKSDPAGIDCGVGGRTACSFDFPAGTTVSLTATAVGIDPAYDLAYVFRGWAGDCQGLGACSLAGNSDKYIVVTFAGKMSVHPNYTAAADHATAYAAGGCTECHGASLQGNGIAPSCSSCHAWPRTIDPTNIPNYPAAAVGDHFRVTAAFDDHDTGWGQACQRCHTDQGFRDYIGVLAAPTEAGVPSDNHLDGTFLSTNTLTTCTYETINTPACDATHYAFGPLKCQTCHNEKFATLTTVMFNNMTTSSVPASVTVPAGSGQCVQCHQGRESTRTVDARIGTKGADEVIGTQSFMNPHYLGAAATLFGDVAKGWAQYPNLVYTGANQHGGKSSCTDCHDPHTGKLPDDAVIASKCGTCHLDETTGLPVANFMQLEESRQFGFEGDIDGDAVPESLKAEIEGLEEKLYAAIRAYSANIDPDGAGTLTAIATCYSDGHPYFFKDNGASPNDGVCQADEAVSTNAYKQFTPRLLRAAFNYKWAHAEPGAWAHNPRYAIEILFDAITDLNAGLTAAGKTAVPFTGKRAFNGHFGAAEDASPYAAMTYHGSTNPPMEFSSAACYQCHGGKVGLGQYLSDPATLSADGKNSVNLTKDGKATSMQCSVCHAFDGADMRDIRNDVANLYFPPQKPAAQQTVKVAADLFPKAADRVCATCHSGREGMLSLVAAKLNPDPGADSWTISPVNPHYLGAAGTMFGSNLQMMYQYEGKSYTGNPKFFGSPHGSPHGQSCTGCHQPKASKHTFEIDRSYCDTCHVVKSYGDFRLDPVKAEVEEATAELYAAIQKNASDAVDAAKTGATTLCYNGAKHPYWYVDVAPLGGFCGAEDITGAKVNPALLKATFNYLWAVKEEGAWAHNTEYVMEVLYDTIVDLGGTPTFAAGTDRPAPTP